MLILAFMKNIIIKKLQLLDLEVSTISSSETGSDLRISLIIIACQKCEQRHPLYAQQDFVSWTCC
jgi:hypothetical protein